MNPEKLEKLERACREIQQGCVFVGICTKATVQLDPNDILALAEAYRKLLKEKGEKIKWGRNI